jgi:hypothetical protein
MILENSVKVLRKAVIIYFKVPLRHSAGESEVNLSRDI